MPRRRLTRDAIVAHVQALRLQDGPVRFRPVIRHLVETVGGYVAPDRPGYVSGQEAWADTVLHFAASTDAADHARSRKPSDRARVVPILICAFAQPKSPDCVLLGRERDELPTARPIDDVDVMLTIRRLRLERRPLRLRPVLRGHVETPGRGTTAETAWIDPDYICGSVHDARHLAATMPPDYAARAVQISVAAFEVAPA